MAKQELKFMIGADNRKALQAMGKFKKSLTSVGATIAGTFGVGLGAAAMVAFTKNLIDQGDQIGKMSKRYGMSTDAMQRFKYMAEISGSSVDGMAKGMKTLNALIGDARHMKTNQRYLRMLNLDYNKLAKMALEDQFNEVAKALERTQNPQERLFLATRLFGKAGADLIPMLQNYSSLAQEAAGHVVFSEDDVKAAEAYKDSMTRLGMSIQSSVLNSGLLPWLADVADRLDKTVGLAQSLERAQAGGMTGQGTSKLMQYGQMALAAGKYVSPAGMLASAMGTGGGEQIHARGADLTPELIKQAQEIKARVDAMAQGDKR